MTDYDELDSIIDEARERIWRVREALACERCDQPIGYGALCRRCDPDEIGLYEENLRPWTDG